MHCPILVTEAVAFEVRVHTRRYRHTLDEFARATLHAADMWFRPKVGVRKLVVPQVTTEDEEGTPPPRKPDLLGDFCTALLPTHAMGPEFHRLSALCEDAVLRLRAQRLSVEAFRGRSGGGGSLSARRGVLNPMTVVPESAMHLSADTLQDLRRVGKRQGTFHRSAAGLAPLTLDPSDPKQGIEINRSDLVRWFPVMQHYGYLDQGLKVADLQLTSIQEEAASAFSRFIGVLLEGVCLLLLINHLLPRTSFRQDLLIIHYRACRIRDAWAAAFLQAEGAIHRLNAYADWLTEKLQVLASKAAPSESIFGMDDAVPLVAGARKAEGVDEQSALDDDIEAFELQGE